MGYDYVLTYADYKDALALYRKRHWKAAVAYYIWIWVLPIAGCIAMIPLFLRLSGSDSKFISLAPFSFAGIWFALCVPALRIRNARKCWKRLLPFGARDSIRTEIAIELEMNSNQLVFILPGRSEERYFWSAIGDFDENEKVATLHITKKLFIVIPKRALPSEAWAQLRHYLGNRGTSS